MPQPNILYMHSHDTGRYVAPYGYAVPTPRIQRLAEEGVLFRRMFNAAPTCSPSRAAMLTGMWPHSCGMLGLVNKGLRMPDYRIHVVSTLKQAGYTTALTGIQHVARYSQEIGYNRLLDEGDHPPIDYDGSLTRDTAVKFLNDAPDQPFFLSVGFHDTHRPYPEVAEEDGNYLMPPAPLPDTPETRRDWAAHVASAKRLDTNMGAVLDALEANGLADNTLIICATDHGVAFPDMKCTLTDHGMGVMFIMRGPGGFTGGKVVDAMLSHVDVFPTLCEVLEIDPPEWLQGTSFMPILRGETEEVRDELFAEVTFHAGYEPKRCVRTQRWKYIRRFDGRTRRVFRNTDDGGAKSLWIDNGWMDIPIEEESLYDLMFDPQERRNLAGDPAHGETLAELRGRLQRWMEDTDDPILKGPVPVPEDAGNHDPDSMRVG